MSICDSYINIVSLFDDDDSMQNRYKMKLKKVFEKKIMTRYF